MLESAMKAMSEEYMIKHATDSLAVRVARLNKGRQKRFQMSQSTLEKIYLRNKIKYKAVV